MQPNSYNCDGSTCNYNTSLSLTLISQLCLYHYCTKIKGLLLLSSTILLMRMPRIWGQNFLHYVFDMFGVINPHNKVVQQWNRGIHKCLRSLYQSLIPIIQEIETANAGLCTKDAITVGFSFRLDVVNDPTACPKIVSHSAQHLCNYPDLDLLLGRNKSSLQLSSPLLLLVLGNKILEQREGSTIFLCQIHRGLIIGFFYHA